MERFFFDIDNGVTRLDRTGIELDCEDAVRSEALLIAAQQLWVEGSKTDGTAIVVTVRDEANATRLKVRLVSQVSTS